MVCQLVTHAGSDVIRLAASKIKRARELSPDFIGNQMKTIASFIICLLMTSETVMSLEEPEFRILSQKSGYQVRQYPVYLVAEVDVEGDLSSTGNQAFKVLAGYIFGSNKAGQKMEMTAPVTSTKVSNDVRPTASRAAEGYTYAFVMERAFTMETLPSPDDPRVRLREMKPRTMAVRTYSGRWTEQKCEEQIEALLTAVGGDGLEPIGRPILARYDPPFMPWFLRRNEVMVEIDGYATQ